MTAVKLDMHSYVLAQLLPTYKYNLFSEPCFKDLTDPYHLKI